MMTQKLKKKKTEPFSVVGVVHQERTIEEIAIDIDCLSSDLLSDSHNNRSCVSNAETIMHMCADIIVMSKNQKA